MIWFGSSHGLCNRLRPIASGLRIATIINKSPGIWWKVNRHCNCHFNDLFINKIPTIDHPPKNAKVYQGSHNFLRAKGYKILHEYEDKSIFFKAQGFVYLENEPLGKLNKQHSQALRILIPIKHIRDEIDKHKILTKSAVGLHIRRTDHRYYHNKKTASNEDIISYIKDYDKVFLSTDCDETDARLKAMSKKIVSYPKKHWPEKMPNKPQWCIGNVFRSKKAIQQALVDLILLSQTEKIIANTHSSFSDTAAIMGDISLDLIQ